MTRLLNVKDASPMAQIHKESFFQGWPASDMEAHIHKDLCFGRGRPLEGFIILRSSANQAEILTLAVAPQFRRQGLAREVLEIAETELIELGVETLFLEVAEDNEPAIAFYKNSQFSPIGRRPAYYRRAKGRVAALTFQKGLS